MTVEQGQVEVALRIEVAVDDRLRHPGRGGDVIEAGSVVAPLSEQMAGRLDDQGTTFGDRKALFLRNHGGKLP